MQSGKIITLSVWLMIIFNLLLAIGAIWNFQRMKPGIKQIYERNIISISACEEMLAALAQDKVDTQRFRISLDKAVQNITESGEKEALARLQQLFKELESGNIRVRRQLAAEIVKVSDFNRQAIVRSAVQTQKHRQAGAWGIVFITLLFFVLALFFEQRLRRTLLQPLQEISQVMEARVRGDKFRRCNMLYANSDMKKLFMAINALLDRRD